jgi:hypothetical protein
LATHRNAVDLEIRIHHFDDGFDGPHFLYELEKVLVTAAKIGGNRSECLRRLRHSTVAVWRPHGGGTVYRAGTMERARFCPGAKSSRPWPEQIHSSGAPAIARLASPPQIQDRQ